MKVLWNGDKQLMVGTKLRGAAAPNNGRQLPAGQLIRNIYGRALETRNENK